MAQFFFFALLMITLLAGIFSYYSPSPQHADLLKFLMNKSGLESEETVNTNRLQQINVTTNNGIMQIRKQMDDLAVIQKGFQNSIQDQMQMMDNANKNASDIVLAAKKQGGVSSNDILQIQALASQIQNEQSLMVAHGQDLVLFNDQISQERQSITDQIDYAQFYTDSIFRMLQKRNRLLKAQEEELFRRMYAYHQEMRDAMARMREKQYELENTAYENKVLENMVKERIRNMLDKEHEEMRKLADLEEKNRDLWRDNQEKLAEAKELIDDEQQQNKDLIEENRQKILDQQSTMQQRITDQRQRMQDQQGR